MGLIVVSGPPASGKTTWVREHARPGDIVVDYDRLVLALTVDGSDTLDHPRHLRSVASRARSAAIREALQHTQHCDVYVIHSLPPADALARYAEHNAQLITIDPGRDVVLTRIRRERPPTMLAVAERWYASNNHAAQPATVTSRPW
ncbi:AAA family ATPase [Microbispora sp. NPDC004025]